MIGITRGNKWLIGFLAAGLLALSSGGAASAADSPALAVFKKAIRAQYDIKEKAFAEHKVSPIVDGFYAKDVISVGQGEDFVVGRAALRPLYEKVVKEDKVRVQSVYSYVNGNAGWDWANFYVMPNNPKVKPFSFIILFLWAKEHSKWICKGDIYVNGVIPSPAAMKTGSDKPGAPPNDLGSGP